VEIERGVGKGWRGGLVWSEESQAGRVRVLEHIPEQKLDVKGR
jgi:hypothetical protein